MDGGWDWEKAAGWQCSPAGIKFSLVTAGVEETFGHSFEVGLFATYPHGGTTFHPAILSIVLPQLL